MVTSVTAVQHIGVLLADDEEHFRGVLRALLGREDDIRIVGEASDGREAIAAARTLVPDLLLLDVRLPVMDGIEAATEVHRLLPDLKIVMVTVSDEEDDVRDALQAGASGYLLKAALPEDLPKVMRAVVRGAGMVLSMPVASKLFGEPGAAD